MTAGAPPGGVGVGRQHDERDQQRQILGERAPPTAQAGHLEHGLDADQLQRDVGHRGDEPGDRDRQRQLPGAVAAADEVGRGDVAMSVADRPQPRHEHEDDRVEDDRVGHREEAGHCTGGEHRGRHGHERVGGVEVPAEQEPGHPGPELAAAQPPFVQAVQRGAASKPGGPEAEHGDDQEQDDQHGQRDSVDAGGLGDQRHHSSPSMGVESWWLGGGPDGPVGGGFCFRAASTSR